MEKDLEAMNILWNTLRQAMAEKERKNCFNPENNGWVLKATYCYS